MGYVFSVKYNVSLDGHKLVVHPSLSPKDETEALDLSIQKWEEIVKWHEAHPYGYLDDNGWITCGLCRYHQVHCQNCIIYKATGHGACAHTPYSDAYTLEGAEAELAFLKSLKECVL